MIVTKWVVVVKVAQCDFEVDSEDNDEILISNAINPPRDILDGSVYSIEDDTRDAIDTVERLTGMFNPLL